MVSFLVISMEDFNETVYILSFGTESSNSGVYFTLQLSLDHSHISSASSRM